MRITVLGSGSAFSTCGCNAGYLVDGRVLIDCGAPVPALVRRAATSIHAITLVLLTHFHADHSFMLPTILGARAFSDPAAPGSLVIGGPVGTREYITRLVVDGYGSHIRHEIDVNVAPEYVALQDGSDVELGPDDVVVRTTPRAGFTAASEGGVAVALDLELDDDLRRRGAVRELIRQLQDLRKDTGLELSDRVEVWLEGCDDLRDDAAVISREVLAIRLEFTAGEGPGNNIAGADGRAGKAWLRKA